MHKQKQLSINMIANIISFLITFSISFLVMPYIVEKLGSEAYGFIQIANNMVSFINIFSIALNSMGSRFITIELVKKDKEEANKDFNSLFLGNIILSLMLIVPLVILIANIEKILNIPLGLIFEVKVTFLIIMLNIFITLITNVFSVATFYKNRLDISAKITIISNIAKVIILAILFGVFKPKVYFIAISTLIYTIIYSIKNIKICKKIMPEITFDFKKAKLSSVIKLVKAGVWNSISQIGSFLIQTLDLWIINILLGATISGEYSIVKTIPSFIQSVVIILVSVFIPNITRMYAKKDKEGVLKETIFSTKITSIILTLPISFMIALGEEFFTLWVPTQNASYLNLLSIMCLLPLIITTSINIIYNIYTVTNKVKIPAIVSIIFGTLQTVSILYFINYKQANIILVVFIINILSILRNLIFAPIYASRCLKCKWYTFYKSILRGILCSIVMISICKLFGYLINIDSWMKLFSIAVISSIISLSINSFIVFNKEERIYGLRFIKNVFKIGFSIFKKVYFNIRWKVYKTYCKTFRKKVYILFGIPAHGNIGDQAIAFAESEFLKKNKICFFEVYSKNVSDYIKIIKQDDVKDFTIILHGGGYMGTLWPEEELMLRKVIKNFQDNKIIVMPQTIYYSKDESTIDLEESINLYNSHKNLYICAREKMSYDFMKEKYNANILLVPDMVYTLNIKRKKKKDNAVPLLCFRKDKEIQLSNKSKDLIEKIIKKTFKKVNVIDTVINKNVTRRSRKKQVYKMIKKFKDSKFVISDRLHALIFSNITGTPCIVFNNCSGKVESMYNTWVKDNKNIYFIKEINRKEISNIINHVNIYEPITFDKEYSKLKKILLGE